MNLKVIINILFCFCLFSAANAQEYVAPLQYRPLTTNNTNKQLLKKTTALSLPFFEDFTSYNVFPDIAKWTDHSVYINNTMCVGQISRGVATFDALNAEGGPYDSTNNAVLLYADSLTSQPIDLSLKVPGDSIYLSFLYQPQGNGFSPEPQDSLMLFFKTNTNWVKVWSVPGTTVQPFKMVIIPVVDTAYFKNNFQFRFVNKASININDDVWNVDYIKLDANRNLYDTAILDLATSLQPTNILNDYTSMPYRQFLANKNNELATQHAFTIRNNYATPRSFVSGYVATETTTNTNLFSSGNTNSAIPGYTEQQFQYPMYNINFTTADPYAKVIFENKYYASQPIGSDPKENDTIAYDQVFDNYLAYDDGTAEESYFLNQFSTLPAETAIEFHLNQPDTIRGAAIYFGRQVPLASNKIFSLVVYKNIGMNGSVDTILYQQDIYYPRYADTVNHFWVYKFDTPIALNAGTFYLGTIQPVQTGSDSLYFGLDVNRVGGNHLYVNYLGYWQPSIVSGALMIRPMIGQPIIATDVATPNIISQTDWTVYPNPAKDILTINFANNNFNNGVYEIRDIQGRALKQGTISANQNIDISILTPGIYFVRIIANGVMSVPKKIIKL